MKFKRLYPDLPLYGSETSSCTSSRGVYHLPIEKYEKNGTNQVTSYDLIGPKWAYPPDIEFHFQEMNPRFMGEFIWTGFDYLGEPTPYGGRDNSTHGYWNDDWPQDHHTLEQWICAVCLKTDFTYIKANGQINRWFIYFLIGTGKKE